MSTGVSIEYMFSQTYLKYLKEEQESLKHMICGSVLEPNVYAVCVGRLAALKEAEFKYKELEKQYFAN